nr:hypothetical protein [Tanacetum cinerariifolium]
MVDMPAPSGQAPVVAPPVRPLLLPPPYRQYTSSSSGIQFNMTRKLETTGVSWMNNAEVLVDLVNQLGYPRMVRNVSNIVTNDMFQPWRALTTIINLCLMGKTSGFERPRALVLQILWGIIIQSNIDYAERIWEEFTQSIHTFMKDKRNLSRHTTGKKRATLILIPSIRFTKLIIHHLQRRHKFHPRPDFTLHLANDKPVLSQEASVHCIETPSKPSISSLVASTQFAPTSAPAKSQENKRKQATETTDKPAKAKRIKHSISRKTRQPRSSPKSVGTSEAEEVPAEEPRVADEEADYQKAVEESLKTAHAAKRKNPLEQYIFQRRIFEPTGSSFHDESPYDVLGQSDSEEESKKVLTGASEGGNDDVQTGPDPNVQNEGQKETDADTLDEGQAG